MKLVCQNKQCLCHYLCPTGHFMMDEQFEETSDIYDNILGCSYYNSSDRHILPLPNNSKIKVCLCNKQCTGIRSGGTANIGFVNGKWIIIV